MKFIFISDIHFSFPNDKGFHTQTKYTEQSHIIVNALGKAALDQQAEFIINAGDLINEGTVPEIREAVECCTALPVPFYTLLGNHDCMREDFEELWLEHGKKFFPEGTLERTFVRGGLRFDLLTNAWGSTSPVFSFADGWKTRLEEKQFARLRAGDQSLPRIIVFHAAIRGAYPRQTGLEKNIHDPLNGFDETGDRIIEEFHPLLIAGGHNHLNLLEKIKDTYAMTVSALCEAPFEYKLLEYSNGKLSMQTCSLTSYLPFRFEYDETKKYVQGDECDRSFCHS